MMKNLYSRLCVCKWLLFSVFFSLTVSSWAQNGPTVTPAFDQICRDEPVSVSITANSPFHAGDTLQWWIASSNDNGNNPTRWTKYKQSTSTTLVVDKIPDGYGNNMYVWVTDYKEDCPDGKKNKAARVRLKPNDQCPNIQCRETATGDVTSFGTDFTPLYGQQNITFYGRGNEIEETFPPNTSLTVRPGYEGTIVSQSYELEHYGFDGILPPSDEENYFLRLNRGGADQTYPVDLNFWKPDYHVGRNNISYNIVMRSYYSIACTSDHGEYRFSVETTTGNEMKNARVTVVVVDMADPTQYYTCTVLIPNVSDHPVLDLTGRPRGTSGMIIANENQGDGPLKGVKLLEGHTYQIDCIFYGTFSGSRRDYTYQPKFFFPSEDSDGRKCAKNQYLLDYINYETEGVCVTPRTACLGEWIDVKATGFPYDATQIWQVKQDNGQYVNVPASEIQYEDATRKHVKILMSREGTVSYRVVSSLDSNDYFDFTMTGEDCESLISPSIQGDPLVCVSATENTATYKVVNTESLIWMSSTPVYNWELKDPTGATVSSYLNQTTGEDVTITFPATAAMSADNANKPYELSMTPSVGGYSYDNYKKTVEIIVNRTPDLSGVIMDIPEVCPAIEKTDTIVLRNAEGVLGNSFKWYAAQNIEYKEGYSDLLKPDSLEVDFGHKNFCNSASDVNIPIKYVSENNGCKDSLEGALLIHKMNAPQIVCPADTVCALDENCEYHGYVVVPEVSSSVDCGDSVKTIEWVRPGLPDTVVSVGDVLDLPKGDNLFVYKIVDNCNHVGSCTRTVSVKDMTNPEVVCPPDTTLYLKDDGCYLSLEMPIATGSDNCSNVNVDLDFWYYTPNNPADQMASRGNEYYVPKINPTFDLCDEDNYIIWFAVDAAGNKSEVCKQNITLADSFPPVISCPAVKVVDLTSSCKGSVQISAPNVSDNTNNCSYCNSVPSAYQVALYYSLDDGASYTQWTKTNGEKLTLTSGPDTLHVLWVAVDYFNNHSDTCDQVIVFRDMADPEIVCPDDVTAYAHTSCDEEVEIGLATATDSCGIDSILYSLDGGAFVDANDSKVSVTVHVGSHTVTWKAVDVNGRSATCTQNVDLLDSLGIEKHCPTEPNAVINTCTDLTWAEVLAQLSASQKATMGSTDCSTGDGTSIDPTMFYKSQTATAYEPMIPSTNLSMDTLYDIKWLFEKSGENVSTMKDSCFSTVLLTDKSDPITHCENIETVTLNPKGCDTIYTVVPPTGVFSDACTDDADLQYVFYLDGRGEFSYGTTDSMTFRLSNGGHWITWAVLDEHGNVSDTCGHAIKVVDKNPPVIECAPVADIQLDVTTGCDTTIVLTSPEVKDSCGVAAVYYKMGDGVEHLYTAGSNTITISVGDTLVKWYAKDATGNTSDTCESVYTVKDVAKPEVVCPSDVQVKVYTRCDTTLTLAEPTVSDNCSYKLYYTIGSESEKLYESAVDYTFNLGTTVVTWRAVDPSANEKSCTVSYTVTDSSSIMISCPKNDNLTLDVCKDMVWSEVKGSLTGDYAANASRTDCQNGVNETLTPTFYYKKQSEGESAYVALTDASTFILDIAYDIKWMFEKGGGDLEEMKDSCISHVLLTDKSDPITHCENIEPVTLNPTGCDTIYTVVPPTGVFSDACTDDADLQYVFYLDGRGEFSYGTTDSMTFRLSNGGHWITWAVLDEHGNVSDTCGHAIKVVDTIPPTIECAPIADIKLEITTACDTALSIEAPTVTDACDTFVVYYRIGNGDTAMYHGAITPTLPKGETVIKWFAQDTSGNISDTCYSTYTVTDVAAPKIDCPSDTAFKLYQSCDTMFTLTFPRDTDNCSVTNRYYRIGTEDSVAYTAPFSHKFLLGETTITWISYDATKNRAECVRHYTVTDSSSIMISCPKNDSLTLDVCEDMVWSEVKNSLTGDYAANASRTDCQNGVNETLTPTFYYKKQSEGESAYVALTDALTFSLDIAYDVKWMFEKGGGDLEEMKDSCISHILLTDTTAPTADCNIVMPALEPYGCDTLYLLEAPIGAFHDNCTPDDQLLYRYAVDKGEYVHFEDNIGGNKILLPIGSHEVFWYAEDEHGNKSDTCSYTLVVKDILPPTVECETYDIPTLEVTQRCDTTLKIGAPKVTDCDTFNIYYRMGNGDERLYDDSLLVTFSVGDTLIKWYAKDTTGNTSDTCFATYNVKDVSKPVITCPADSFEWKLFFHCDSTIVLEKATASDPCGYDLYYKIGDEDEALYPSSGVSYNFPLGSTNVRWRAVDPSGNENTCTVVYTLKDSSGINISCPAEPDLTIDVCSDSVWSFVKTYLKGDYAASARQMDCAKGDSTDLTPTFFYKKTSEGDNSYVALVDASRFVLDENYDIKWLFSKEGENATSLLDSCISHVVLTDTSAPSADCDAMKDIVLKPVTCDTSYQFGKPLGVFDDICGEENLTYYYKLDDASDFVQLTDGVKNLLGGGTHKVVWRVEDAHHNVSKTCEQNVSVLDTIPPTIECAPIADIKLEITTDCDTAPSIVAPAVTDACDTFVIYYRIGNGDTAMYHGAITPTLPIGETVIKWFAQDTSGNISDTCYSTYTVTDVAAPIFDCPSDTAFKLYHNCDTTFSISFPIVNDNCDVTQRFYRFGAADSVVYTAPVEHKFSLGETTVTWIAYDAAGNRTVCERNYNVTDNTSITTSCPSQDNVVIDTCEALSWSAVLALYTDEMKAVASRLDCANDGNVIDIEPIMSYKKASESVYADLSGTTLLEYNTLYDLRWKFEKNGENMESLDTACYSQVILRDTSAPTRNCEMMQDIVLKPIACDSIGYVIEKPDGVFDDNCDESNLTYYFKMDDDAAFTEFTGSNGRDVTNGTHTVVWKVADKMGNESDTCMQTISVLDTIAPAKTCPMDTTVKVVAGCQIELDLPVMTATDACGDPKVFYSFDDENFEVLGTSFRHTLIVGDTTIYWYAEDIHGNKTDTCHYTVTVLDTIVPTITCPDDISIPLTEGCNVDVTLNPASALDNCQVDSIYYSYDKVSFDALPTLTSTVVKNFAVGSYTVYWFAKDIHGLYSDTCEQSVSILDDHGFDLNCPTNSEDGPFIVEACTDLPWKDLNDSLTALNMNASATYMDCATSLVTPIDSVIMKVSLSGENNWSVMDDDYVIKYNTAYDIRWIFVKAGDNLVTKSDSCFLSVLVKDTTAPDFNCDDIDPDSVVYIAHDVCELPYSDITLNEYIAHDNCDGDIVGVLSTTENLADSVKAADVFKVGTLYHLYWIFQDKTGNKVFCDQSLMLNSDLKPLFNCDSLKKSPITKVLHDACVTDSADLAINTPIAYDACTKDPILGVGHRKSGEAMNGTYAVGRDTIVWVFKSIYSTALDSCEQYIYISSDKKLDFDCDSLNKAVIDTVLQGVCEIDSASLNFTSPFALDVCTNDTIWGVGVRKSGEPMDGIYKVGRDTISWTFISEYSTDTVVCDQYIYIKSDKDLLFDCDSLNKAPIERILHDVCEIDSAGLNMIVPFALDACTNDTIWGVGARKSGEPMGGTYKVGRDTISWTFISEYSTDTVVCDQYIYIGSDKKLDFDCDSLNKAVIERVLLDVCETDSVGLKFTAPFALDACTNDTIWGVGARKSGEPMNGVYKVGRDTISWTFISEYSTDTVVCDQYIYIKSDKDLLFDCDSLNNAPIERVLDGVCETDSTSLNMVAPFALDACTNDTIWGVGARKSGEPMNGVYKVGRDTISWTFISEYSTDTVVCEQYIYIMSDKDLLFDCDSLNKAVIERVLHDVCETDSVGLNFTVPFALDACTNDTVWGVGSRKSGEPMDGTYKVGRDTISWTFISEYSTDTVVCDQYIYIKSDKDLLFDCDSLNNAPIERVLNGICEADSASLNFTAPYALDACTNDTIWGVGARKSGEPMNGVYKVGRDTISWTFIGEYSTGTVVCDQYVYIQSDIKPKFDCDSLRNAPIERVLNGVCEIDSAGLNMIVPFALDACTNDTIWGRGTRTSGEPMGGTYKVGRDTIIWVFDSEYSTSNDTCEQYIFIQSDLKPKFDCDSLHDSPIHKVLVDTCIVSPADLNINTPFALDACTNDTIWGVGTRKSGKLMSDNYEVGRDTIVWVFDSEYSTSNDTCEQYVFIQSNIKPIFDCDSLKNAKIEKVLEDVCEISAADLNVNIPFALDACTNDTVWGVGTRTSGREMDASYVVGHDTIVWKFISEFSTDSAVCEQYVFIQSNKGLEFDCDSLKNTPITSVLHGVCEVDSATLNFIVPFAMDGCMNDTVWGVGYRKSGEPMGGTYKVGRDTIVWKFSSEFVIDELICEQPIFIQSDLAPKFDCDSLKKEVIDTVLHGVCEIDFASLNFNIPFALDACTNDTVWGVGTRTSGLSMGDSYKVGRDTIVWTFTSEFSTESSVCEQYIFIQSDLAPVVDCDSLKANPIEKDLHGVCEVVSDSMDLTIPFALDACTNDTIWGVGTRTSGLAMDGIYKVGRDTIIWKFKSEFSTDSTLCEQYLLIRSDLQPVVDCDSLKNAVVDTVLHEVCEISAADLNVNIPFALDACTNDTIWGEGSRTSGLDMSASYHVGRDTIIWRFVSPYSTDTTICEQPVFVRSDKSLDFDCDSLKNAPIERVLEGVCEIAASELDVNTPYAVDACTNEKIYGVGTRTSGRGMDDAYVVGRDTIVWTFISEFSTDTVVCEQSVFIQSDMAPKFNCDSLKQEVIDTVLHGVCEISAADLNIHTPVAFDACTNDSVLGVGYRKSGKEMTDNYSVGRDTIVWVFDSEYSTLNDTCEQYVYIQSDMKPSFDCDSLHNAPITKVLSGVCSISSADLNVVTPFALDACTKDTVWGVGQRTSGKSMTDDYAVGHDTIVWVFDSEFSTNSDTCEQYVFIQSDMAPKFDCDSLKDAPIEKVLNGICEISAADLNVNTPFALDACTNDTIWGVGRKTSGRDMDSSYVVGHDTIVWTFTSVYSTTAADCEQYVFIQSDMAPKFDCDSLKDTVLYIAMDQCVIPAGRFVMETPVAKDACTDEDVVGVPSRSDSLALEDVYPVGVTTITWTFTSPLSTTPLSCSMTVTVLDTFPPVPNCDDLDTIHADITVASLNKTFTTYEEAVKAGLVSPTVDDLCDGTITATGVREDGSPLEGNFEIGNTTVVWTFTDNSGNSAICTQIVKVEDHGADTLFCPGVLDGSRYVCLEDVPAGYDSYEAFKAAGGSFTTESKIVEGSFRYTDEYDGDSCSMVVTRTYMVTDTRGDIDSCQEVVYVMDTVAPKFDFVLRDTTLSCEDSIFKADSVSATDNCDGGVTIRMIETNDRTNDVMSCDYYNYNITRTYIASDRCGNRDTMIQHIFIRDTIGPKFNYPGNWGNEVLAKSLKGCEFEVPDFTMSVKSMTEDNCTENAQLTVVQVPAAGTSIRRSTYVWIYVSDMCGNTDSTSKYVRVQQLNSIVTITAPSRDTCVTDEVGVSLANQQIRYATGIVEEMKPDGTIRKKPSVFCFDYYRGDVSRENLMFSDNPKTYRDEFLQYSSLYGNMLTVADELTKLHQRSESGFYSFVAMDTTTGCSDTATAYINVLERPKVKIVSAQMPVCEGNYLNLDPYLQCVDSMGASITNEYWMVDTMRFDPYDSIMGKVSSAYNGKLISYYAENRCGSTSSLNSHALLNCYDDSLTTKDSLLFLEGDSAALTMLRLNQIYSKDSILLDVHTRFNPDSIIIETEPHDPARIWRGENVTLALNTKYDYHYLVWHKVVGKYDMENYDSSVGEGFFFNDPDDEEDEIYEISGFKEQPYILDYPEDTTYYYVTITDGVCPETPSAVTEVDVLQEIPTAFTPFVKDGYNDVFMEHHHVVIYDRYGQKVFVGDDGWPGTHKGHQADPGVYFYELVMGNGLIVRGTIEVVKID